jgi:hypothetical protein
MSVGQDVLGQGLFHSGWWQDKRMDKGTHVLSSIICMIAFKS